MLGGWSDLLCTEWGVRCSGVWLEFFCLQVQGNTKEVDEANKKFVKFLDVTLNLNTGKFMPYSNTSNTPLYVHKKSNHPPNINVLNSCLLAATETKPSYATTKR